MKSESNKELAVRLLPTMIELLDSYNWLNGSYHCAFCKSEDVAQEEPDNGQIIHKADCPGIEFVRRVEAIK